MNESDMQLRISVNYNAYLMGIKKIVSFVFCIAFLAIIFIINTNEIRAEQLCESLPDLSKSKLIEAESLNRNKNKIIKSYQKKNIIFTYFSDPDYKKFPGREIENASGIFPAIAVKVSENTFRVWEFNWGDTWEYVSYNKNGIFSVLDHAVEGRGWCLTFVTGIHNHWVVTTLQKPSYMTSLYKVKINERKVKLTVELEDDSASGVKAGYYTSKSLDFGKTWSSWEYSKK